MRIWWCCNVLSRKWPGKQLHWHIDPVLHCASLVPSEVPTQAMPPCQKCKHAHRCGRLLSSSHILLAVPRSLRTHTAWTLPFLETSLPLFGSGLLSICFSEVTDSAQMQPLLLFFLLFQTRSHWFFPYSGRHSYKSPGISVLYEEHTNTSIHFSHSCLNHICNTLNIIILSWKKW